MSSISATINGEARLVERGTEEERYYREMHLDNNTFSEGEEQSAGQGIWDVRERQDGGRGMYIEGEEVRVVVVKVTDGRVSDWKGGVRDWTLAEEGENNIDGEALVNGVAGS